MFALSEVAGLSHVFHERNLRVKGTVARDFRPSVFHQSTPPRALIHGQKPFCKYSNFSGVNDPAKKISALWSLAPLKLSEFFFLNKQLSN
jgi:hypothetical protein